MEIDWFASSDVASSALPFFALELGPVGGLPHCCRKTESCFRQWEAMCSRQPRCPLWVLASSRNCTDAWCWPGINASLSRKRLLPSSATVLLTAILSSLTGGIQMPASIFPQRPRHTRMVIPRPICQRPYQRVNAAATSRHMSGRDIFSTPSRSLKLMRPPCTTNLRAGFKS